MFDKERKTICRAIRDIYKVVLKTGDKELIEKTEGNIRYTYLCAKKMNKKLNWYAHAGELPNPDSPGWTESFWIKQLNKCKRGWKA
jgi:hypothetical protein